MMEANRQKKVVINKEGAIALIQINEPKTLNALSTEILNELNAAFDKVSSDTSIRAIILTGTERSFVAGADIKEMSTYDSRQGKAFGKRGATLFRKIELMPKPIIAAINGFALGGGCELALACDIRIASEKAKFGQPEVTLGIIPGFSGTQRLPRIVGAGVAKELIFTGRIIRADEALQIKLVNKVVPHETLMEEAINMANAITAQAPLAVQYAKEAINKGLETNLDTAISYETNLFAICFATDDQKNGMKAFLSKEKAAFKGK